ncbi:MAG: hypothetical protein DSO09_02550 [Candidatus Methanomethylicota archaeon]|jgi:translin|uniref:Haloacid dehalogenase n=1 Tax=Thermoproteota archaeon TaxID=2056631 RepID=A0A523BEF7_9CREN|nr:MAG: hypothetical protein EF809_02770 [Candidatus Verstraetearchaeota archaeon]TDA39274.1 MAG: hypothetical protein DSO09_02550 [Candidatus Verstraetearchaeota archaeon]
MKIISDNTILEIEEFLKRKDEKRELLILKSREIIRNSSKAIIFIHRKDFEKAFELIKSIEKILNETFRLCEEYPEYKYIGPLPQAIQEYAEAILTFYLIKEGRILSPKELGIPLDSYINGLIDSVGELRRYILDLLREDDIKESEKILEIMDEIYTMIKGLEFAKGVLPNIKRKIDIIRRIVEETKANLTFIYHSKLIIDSYKK